MIYFHACRKYTFTMNTFVHSWDKPLAQHVICVPYGDLDLRKPIPAGLHIFADFERLKPLETRNVQAVHDRMLEHPESYSVINNPAAWSGRLGLNQALSAAGRNDYRAFRIGDVPSDLRFPAFVRWENEHNGSLGEPVMSRAEIQSRASEHARGRRLLQRRKLLVIEKIDARDPDGYYRKYSAQKIGDKLIPRCVYATDNWVTKYPPLLEPDMIAAELEYVQSFPHHDEINEVFAMSGLDYGRIDYGVVDGRIQVWEINTNPLVSNRHHLIEPERAESQELSGRAVLAQLRRLAERAPSGPAMRLFGGVEGQARHASVLASHRYDKTRN